MAPKDCAAPSNTSKRAIASRWKSCRSAYGTPSSSQITSDGIGSANASTRSTGPLRSMPSRHSVDDVVDARAQPGQAAHRELRREQPPQPGVHRRIGEAEPAGIGGRARNAAADQVREVGGERVGVGQYGFGLRVAR